MTRKNLYQSIFSVLALTLLLGVTACAHPVFSLDNNAPLRAQSDRFQEMDEFFSAPSLSGTEETFDTANFRIHYTRSGEDAVPRADADNNGTPDYVERVAELLEEVHDILINQLGWLAPPSDNGFGGNDLYNVYLEEMLSEGIAGFVDGGFDETTVGDNPNSLNVIETRSSFSLMGLDNDYVEEGVFQEDLLRTTVAHEYMHSIQMGYDGQETLEWLWEATATWIQDEVYDEVNDADELIAEVVGSPSTCQFSADPYAMWIFLRHISENYGHNTVRNMWEQAVNLDGYAVVEAALNQVGTTLDNVIRNFAVSILIRDFKEGVNYPTVRLEGTLSDSFSPNAGVEQVGYDFLQINASGINTISLDNRSLTGRVVGINGSQADVFDLENGQVTVNADNYDQLFLVVINANLVSDVSECQGETYTATLNTGGQAGGSPIQFNAANFEAPQEGEFGGRDFGGDDGFGGSDGDFTPIDAPEAFIPANLPADLELVDAFEEEFEGNLETVLIFENFDGDFMQIVIRDSFYDNLDDLFSNEFGFELSPADTVRIQGVEVAVEDLSEPGDPYFIATFILDGLVIEVSSNLGTNAVIQTTSSLLDQLL